MPATEVTIANDVRDLIAAASLSRVLVPSVERPPDGWSSEHTVVRAYLAEYHLSDMAYTRCAVLPVTYESEAASRSARRETFGIDIVIQAKPEDIDERDAMMQLASEVNQLLEYESLATSGAVWVGVERTPLFNTQSFDEGQMFASSSRHSFRLIRNVT